MFGDLIADMINNKKLHSVVTELFLWGWKLNISLVFTTQSYFQVAKDVTVNTTHFFFIKIPNRRELQEIATNHSADINFDEFKRLYRKCIAEPYSFLVIDTTLPSDNALGFRENLLKEVLRVIMTDGDKIRDKWYK